MRRRKALTTAGIVITLALLVVLVLTRWHAFSTAAAGASPWLLVGAVALHVLSLLSRSEAWLRCIRAAGGTVCRRRVYRAASVGYVGNVVNGELGFALRIATLRTSAPEEVPRLATLAATEVPMVMVDVTLASLTSFTLVGPLDIPWWSPIVAFVTMLALTLWLSRLPRHRATGWRKGLAVLSNARAGSLMAGLVLVSILTQILRNWLMLRAAGINASLLDATAVLIALAVLGALPLGPGTTAAAAVLILGAHGMTAVGAAGVMLTLTAAAGALLYTGWTLVHLRRSTPGATWWRRLHRVDVPARIRLDRPTTEADAGS